MKRPWFLRHLPAFLGVVAAAFPLLAQLQESSADQPHWPVSLVSSTEPSQPEEPAQAELLQQTAPTAPGVTRFFQTDAELFAPPDPGQPAIASTPVNFDRGGSLIFVDYDAYRGLPDGGWENNGIAVGANNGTRLGSFSERTGIGLQAGGSIGVFDWSGTDYRARNLDQAQTQGFFTYGIFKRPTADARFSFGLVNDWMLANNFGVLAATPTLTQLRGQVSYAFTDQDEFGLWGTCRVNQSSPAVPIFGTATFNSVDLISLFYHHHWMFGGDSWLYLGMPEHSRLTHDGSLGSFYVSASATMPLNNFTSVYTNVMYMAPSHSPGPLASPDEAWNFTIGLAFYPRLNAYSPNVYGRRWMPLMPVANNGTFLVDTNAWY